MELQIGLCLVFCSGFIAIATNYLFSSTELFLMQNEIREHAEYPKVKVWILPVCLVASIVGFGFMLQGLADLYLI